MQITVSYKENPKEYNRQWYQINKEKRKTQSREWKKNNKDKIKLFPSRQKDAIKDFSLKIRHGLTLEWFNQQLIKQNNVCTICSRDFKNEKDKCVDHCHHTGKIRQILCFNCNIGIGKFQDSIELLEKALAYLKKHEINKL